MEKKLEISAPIMPNFVRYKLPDYKRKEGLIQTEGFPITDFIREEAEEYGELMKQTFIKHWEKKIGMVNE